MGEKLIIPSRTDTLYRANSLGLIAKTDLYVSETTLHVEFLLRDYSDRRAEGYRCPLGRGCTLVNGVPGRAVDKVADLLFTTCDLLAKLKNNGWAIDSYYGEGMCITSPDGRCRISLPDKHGYMGVFTTRKLRKVNQQLRDAVRNGHDRSHSASDLAFDNLIENGKQRSERDQLLRLCESRPDLTVDQLFAAVRANGLQITE